MSYDGEGRPDNRAPTLSIHGVEHSCHATARRETRATSALDWLCEHGYEQSYGARPLRRLIEQQIENPVAGKILREEVRPGHVVFVDIADGALVFESHGRGTL